MNFEQYREEVKDCIKGMEPNGMDDWAVEEFYMKPNEGLIKKSFDVGYESYHVASDIIN